MRPPLIGLIIYSGCYWFAEEKLPARASGSVSHESKRDSSSTKASDLAEVIMFPSLASSSSPAPSTWGMRARFDLSCLPAAFAVVIQMTCEDGLLREMQKSGDGNWNCSLRLVDWRYYASSFISLKYAGECSKRLPRYFNDSLKPDSRSSLVAVLRDLPFGEVCCSPMLDLRAEVDNAFSGLDLPPFAGVLEVLQPIKAPS